MDFDKKTIFAFVLIGLILILANTSLYQKIVDPKGYELRQQKAMETAQRANSPQQTTPAAKEEPGAKPELTVVEKIPEPREESVVQQPSLTPMENVEEKTITIETSLYKATLSNKGATILQWELKNYPGIDGNPVKMFPENNYGTLGISFITRDYDSLDVSQLTYSTEENGAITLADNQDYTVMFTLALDEYRSIQKIYTFHGGVYAVDFDVSFTNLSDLIADKKYFISAPGGLASTEKRLKDDMMYAKAGTSAGGDVDKKYRANGKVYKNDGVFDWIAVRTKYFAFFIIPQSESKSAEIWGNEYPERPGSKIKWKKYSLKLGMPFLGENQFNNKFKIYLGPLEYNVLKRYKSNLQEFMDFGMPVIKWFSLGVLVVFKWMHKFIPNYGVVLLIFAFVIKIIVYPLTHKSYESMQKMQAIQPKLKDLQEKYKSDPQKLNRATMEMYKKEGVNPMGGCLPMLIQMPLLFGLFIIFRTTIELRGQGFVWWITDLSAPDTIYTFPGGFSLPIYGSSINILPLVMGVTMFFQQKMTVTDPKQKMMVYFMPIFLTLLFNSFPSGLNLYYALFNFLTILQQKYLTPQKMAPVLEDVIVRKRKR